MANIPGMLEQVRLYMTREVGMSFLWELESSPLTDPAAFMRMVDHVLKEFTDEAAKMGAIGDEIVENFLSMRPRLFRNDPPPSAAPAPCPHSASAWAMSARLSAAC